MRISNKHEGLRGSFVGVVTAIELSEVGSVIFTVTDLRGNVFYPCQLTSFSGGADGCFAHAPMKVGTRVMLVDNPEFKRRAFLITAAFAHPEDANAISVDGVKSAIDADRTAQTNYVSDRRGDYYINDDYDSVHVEDMHLENMDNFVNLSEVHGLTLEGSPRVSVQIPDHEQAIFRVAAGGVAENRILNAESFLNRLFGLLEEVVTRIEAIEDNVQRLNSEAAVIARAANVRFTGLGAAAPELDLSAARIDIAADALSSSPEITSPATVRQECEDDKNPYVIVP